MTTHTKTFRGHSFQVVEGRTHPAYSLACFDADGEEGAFREKYWDPQPKQVVVDVGASYGAYALTAAACGATVWAFEPEATVLADLQKNIDLNPGFDVAAMGFGLWDESTEVDMYSYASHWPPGTITAPFKMRTLDSFQLPSVDWLKVDVEGAEERVLLGAMATLRRCRPRIVLEAHVFLSPDLLFKCRALVESLGEYRIEEVMRDPCVMLVCTPWERQ